MKSLARKPLTYLLFILVVVALMACQSRAPTTTPAPTPTASDYFNTAWDDRAIFRPGLIEAEQEVLARDQ